MVNNEGMTISDGIKELKEKRNELQRLIALQKEKFTVFVPLDKTSIEDCVADNPDIILFKDIEEKIQALKKDIMNLRFSLDKTAHETTLQYNGKEITLAYLRLIVEEARADIDRIQGLNKKDILYSDHRRRLTVDDKEREMKQLNDQQLEDLIQQKIKLKNQLDSLLEKTNVNTPLEVSTLNLIL